MKALVRLVGINENTLRTWERRHAAIHPKRGADGRRHYSSSDLERVKLLATLVKRGHAISRIAGLSTSTLGKMVKELPLSIPPCGETSEESKADKHQQRIIAALENFNLEKLNMALQWAHFDLGPRESVMDLILPMLRRVGDMVAAKQMSIVHEHMLSALLRDYLGRLYQSLSPYDVPARKGSRRIAFTTREGDLHEFGALLAAILCSFHRHQTFYFGPSLPAEELALACSDLNIDTIVLGLTKLPKNRESVSVGNYFLDLDERLNRGIDLWYGGFQDVGNTRLKTGRSTMFFPDLLAMEDYIKNPRWT